jgi:hypothetical protein
MISKEAALMAGGIGVVGKVVSGLNKLDKASETVGKAEAVIKTGAALARGDVVGAMKEVAGEAIGVGASQLSRLKKHGANVKRAGQQRQEDLARVTELQEEFADTFNPRTSQSISVGRRKDGSEIAVVTIAKDGSLSKKTKELAKEKGVIVKRVKGSSDHSEVNGRHGIEKEGGRMTASGTNMQTGHCAACEKDAIDNAWQMASRPRGLFYGLKGDMRRAAAGQAPTSRRGRELMKE